MYGFDLASIARHPSSAATDDDAAPSSASSWNDAVLPLMTLATTAGAAATTPPAGATSRLDVLALLDRPSRAPLVISRVKRLARLDIMLDHIRQAAAANPAATRLLPLRLHMLKGLRHVAASAMLPAAPTAAALVNADQAMVLSWHMQQALRSLLQLPASQLAPLVDEERRLAKRQEGLLRSGVISKDANGRSREHAFRAFDVHTAATADRLAAALSAFDRFIDELAPVPTAADHEAGCPERAGEAGETAEVYDPFGVLPYAQGSDATRP